MGCNLSRKSLNAILNFSEQLVPSSMPRTFWFQAAILQLNNKKSTFLSYNSQGFAMFVRSLSKRPGSFNKLRNFAFRETFSFLFMVYDENIFPLKVYEWKLPQMQ